jgi:hypothetical protein
MALLLPCEGWWFTLVLSPVIPVDPATIGDLPFLVFKQLDHLSFSSCQLSHSVISVATKTRLVKINVATTNNG